MFEKKIFLIDHKIEHSWMNIIPIIPIYPLLSWLQLRCCITSCRIYVELPVILYNEEQNSVFERLLFMTGLAHRSWRVELKGMKKVDKVGPRYICNSHMNLFVFYTDWNSRKIWLSHRNSRVHHWRRLPTDAVQSASWKKWHRGQSQANPYDARSFWIIRKFRGGRNVR